MRDNERWFYPAFNMNLHQFRFVQEAARRNLNLTEAAKALHTSQPGVSKAIIELEEELGVEIFARHGKRLKRITEPDLPTTAAELAALGVTEVTIVPMFLGAGRHVREDLPALVADLGRAHPGTRWLLQPPVGENPRLLDLLAELAQGR